MNKTFPFSPSLTLLISSAAQAQLRRDKCYWCQKQSRTGNWDSFKTCKLGDRASRGNFRSYFVAYMYDNDLSEPTQSSHGEGDCYSSAQYMKKGKRIIEVAEGKCGGASKPNQAIRVAAA